MSLEVGVSSYHGINDSVEHKGDWGVYKSSATFEEPHFERGHKGSESKGGHRQHIPILDER